MKKISFTMFLICCLQIITTAQTPQSFNYQAIIKNSEGVAITNQTVSIKISIISNDINGTLVYTETHSTITSNYGLINLAIGTGSILQGNFPNINWSSGLYFIKIEVDPSNSSNYQISGVTQLLSVPYALYAQKAGNTNYSDTSTTNELQTLSIIGNDLSISKGNSVTLPIVSYTAGNGINISGNTISSNITGNATHTGDATGSGALTVVAIRGKAISTTAPANNQFLKWNNTLSQWEPSTINLSQWTTIGNNIYNSNNGNVGIGTTTPNSKLEVKGNGDTLFQVKDANGNPVFIVFPEGVQIYVKEDVTKGNIGGFAVSGRSASKGITGEYLKITPDSSRIYIKETPSNKGNIGGFAVSGRSASKGLKNYLNISVDTTGIINPSQARIVWYPTKAAFLTGQVLIQHKDSVGKNSFSSGYQSKAIGDYSQALGYEAVARKSYSTAIGYKAFAIAKSSYALGDNSKAIGEGSYAIGSGAIARGQGSYAIGSTYSSINPTTASGNQSFAIGFGAIASGTYALSLGLTSIASGSYSTAIGPWANASGIRSSALGYESNASGDYSTAIGNNNKAKGENSVSLGANNISSGNNSTTTGYLNIASGYGSFANGYQTKTTGSLAFSLGNNTSAIGDNSLSMGFFTKAKSESCVVIGQYNDTTTYDTYSYAHWYNNDAVFIIGNGTNNNARKNAMTVMKNGFLGLNRTGFGIDNTITVPFIVGYDGTNGNGAHLTVGGAWTGTSSKTFKDRFTNITTIDLFDKILSLDLNGWYYKGLNEYHIGPFAEEFYNAFGTGDKDNKEVSKYIAATDIAGVSLKAVQELIKENKELKTDINDLKKEIEELKKIMKERK